jgi:hypothetical protein
MSYIRHVPLVKAEEYSLASHVWAAVCIERICEDLNKKRIYGNIKGVES